MPFLTARGLTVPKQTKFWKVPEGPRRFQIDSEMVSAACTGLPCSAFAFAIFAHTENM